MNNILKLKRRNYESVNNNNNNNYNNMTYTVHYSARTEQVHGILVLPILHPTFVYCADGETIIIGNKVIIL